MVEPFALRALPKPQACLGVLVRIHRSLAFGQQLLAPLLDPGGLLPGDQFACMSGLRRLQFALPG
ncbi:MAG TPA: hypothetical protein P5305_22740, partial [Rubrivivax sp.]|nr:hypothetical protein [Rubrivivax sp.]